MRLPNERVGGGGRARTRSGIPEGTPASGNGDGRCPGRGAEMSGTAAWSGVRRSRATLDEREVRGGVTDDEARERGAGEVAQRAAQLVVQHEAAARVPGLHVRRRAEALARVRQRHRATRERL